MRARAKFSACVLLAAALAGAGGAAAYVNKDSYPSQLLRRIWDSPNWQHAQPASSNAELDRISRMVRNSMIAWHACLRRKLAKRAAGSSASMDRCLHLQVEHLSRDMGRQQSVTILRTDKTG